MSAAQAGQELYYPSMAVMPNLPHNKFGMPYFELAIVPLKFSFII